MLLHLFDSPVELPDLLARFLKHRLKRLWQLIFSENCRGRTDHMPSPDGNRKSEFPQQSARLVDPAVAVRFEQRLGVGPVLFLWT